MSVLKLKIDMREKLLKDHFESLENVSIEALDIGDIVFTQDDKNILIIERKTVNDLSASIIDGRHKEQKARLLASGIDKSRILYLVEGSILDSSVTIKGGRDTIIGSIINTQFRDGIKVYKTNSIKETIIFIEKLFVKLNKDLVSFWNYDANSNIGATEYASTLKQKKRDNVTSEVWFSNILISIPQLTSKIAEVIVQKYKSIHALICAYSELSSEKEKFLLLSNLTYTTIKSQRKIGPALSTKIYKLIHGENVDA